ncbi:MAG: pantetheine-phosphate adenylyltransferase [Rhodospirillaceae bacterium]|nr:pantetheine-phosphate adenylyltransferase [Rhodospirillaceae bacterium]
MSKMVDNIIAVYPGTFDPVTNGHLDIIQRAASMFDRLVIGVAKNVGKKPLFSHSERIEMLEDELSTFNNGSRKIVVEGFDSLLVNFANAQGAKVIIRGLRAVSDFDYEFQMASMNAHIAPEIETVCLMASDKNQFIASRLVKEVAILDGDVSKFITERVLNKLNIKVKEIKTN